MDQKREARKLFINKEPGRAAGFAIWLERIQTHYRVGVRALFYLYQTAAFSCRNRMIKPLPTMVNPLSL